MALSSIEKGKKRARESSFAESSSSSSSSAPPAPSPVKKPKRAETRPCPVCHEKIPLRLIPAHAELEALRVEEIIGHVGSTEVFGDQCEESSTSQSRNRRSAIRARKSLTALAPQCLDNLDTCSAATKIIQTIKRRRKQRHVRLREMTRDEEEDSRAGPARNAGDEIVCPVCLQTVRGDEDVMEAHVDACLAFESERLRVAEEAERERRRGAEEIVDVDDSEPAIERVTDETSFRGTGFHVRDRNAQDVEDEVDIDGDDADVFGNPQFTEVDILRHYNDPPTQEPVDIQSDSGQEPREHGVLHDLVAEGEATKSASRDPHSTAEEIGKVADLHALNSVVSSTRRTGDSTALIKALDSKIKHLESLRLVPSTSLVCRICLDPYTEPTASTGCWHTCCRECWLRCLGSTQLCPICKRITAATELRRIYL